MGLNGLYSCERQANLMASKNNNGQGSCRKVVAIVDLVIVCCRGLAFWPTLKRPPELIRETEVISGKGRNTGRASERPLVSYKHDGFSTDIIPGWMSHNEILS